MSIDCIAVNICHEHGLTRLKTEKPAGCRETKYGAQTYPHFLGSHKVSVQQLKRPTEI